MDKIREKNRHFPTIKKSPTNTPVQHISVHSDNSKLTLINNAFTAMKSDAFQDFGHLTELTIENTFLEKVPAYGFNGLSALTSLSICCSPNLTHIESCAFEGLHTLNELRFNGVGIELQNISADVLKGMDKLELLSFSSGYFDRDVPTMAIQPEKRIFTHLPNLVKLDLSEISIPCVYDDFFLGLTGLESLFFHEINWDTIELNALRGLDNLEDFCAISSPIDTIDFGCFKKLQKLKSFCFRESCIYKVINESKVGDFAMLDTLSMLGNRLSVLEVGSFRNMSNLTTLILCFNKINHIDPDLFKSLVRLTDLNLKANRLTNIRADMFKWLSSLESLDLSQNEISCIEPGVCSPLTNLIKLNLKCNKLTEIRTGTFFRLPKLKWINLSKNTIISIETDSIDNELLENSEID